MTMQNMPGMGPLSRARTLPSKLADHPVVWTLQVNGLVIDARQALIEIQRFADHKGFIPFIPALHAGEDA